MPIKFEGKVFPAGHSFRVTIPKPIIRQLKIKGGDILDIWLNDSQIVMARPDKK